MIIDEKEGRKQVHRVKYGNRTAAKNINWNKVDKAKEMRLFWQEQALLTTKHIEFLNQMQKPELL
jgi:hypothetical protein